ncbi:hypothetical protein TIFTF001_031905 [Ficus carica]|uniref:Uncharacterized protein n=1 Tax=Ficus carica TaxID=3494 RepID=A0AA88J725_FICCA|nr:hypothetical protein TIFTF001_031905 [Ficus carica]
MCREIMGCHDLRPEAGPALTPMLIGLVLFSPQALQEGSMVAVIELFKRLLLEMFDRGVLRNERIYTSVTHSLC